MPNPGGGKNEVLQWGEGDSPTHILGLRGATRRSTADHGVRLFVALHPFPQLYPRARAVASELVLLPVMPHTMGTEPCPGQA